MVDLVPLLRAHFQPLQNRDAAQWQTRYMRNQFPFLGVSSPNVRKAIALFKKSHPSADWPSEASALWAQPEREFHYAALLWAMAHRSQATPDHLLLYEEWIQTHSWWDSVDTIAPHLVGPLLLRFPQLIEKTEQWLLSPHLWLRRSALLYPLRWKEKTEVSRLFRYCRELSQDKEFFIRKAIGWVLREYSKTDPSAVADFLQTTPLSPLSRREAGKYL